MGYHKFSKCNSLFFICLFISVYVSYSSNQITADQAALLAFKEGIVTDPENVLESWNASGAPVCKWLGIECHEKTGKVAELLLSHYSLTGTISPFLSNLSDLEVLDLSHNNFEGNIPPELGSLSQLKELSLSSNLLNGSIPVQLGSHHQLLYLDLGSNKLAGEIPESLLCNGSFALQYLDLSDNSLDGKIPLKNECSLTNLKFLLLWSNQLGGEVPPSLANSTKLAWLDLESNSLSWELPANVLCRMPRLKFLYLSYNNFSLHGNTDLHNFFASLRNSSNLEELELAGNGLSGKLSSIIGNLSVNLIRIRLDDNHIYGSIPTELCQFQKLERLNLANNLLSGNIPSAFGNCSPFSHSRFIIQ